MLVHVRAQPTQELMAPADFATGAIALEEVGDGVATESIQSIEPEGDDVQHLFLDSRVVVIQVWLMAEKAVPVMLARDRVQVQLEELRVLKMIRASQYRSGSSLQT